MRALGQINVNVTTNYNTLITDIATSISVKKSWIQWDGYSGMDYWEGDNSNTIETVREKSCGRF